MKLVDRLFSRIEGLHASDRMLLKLFLGLTLASMVWLFAAWSKGMSVAIPRASGAITEGIIGTPRFTNPILAVTTADKDLSSVVYAGLMKLGKNGSIEPNLAESLTVSDDGLTYNIILKEGLTFHDGTPLSVNDVIYTISAIQDPMVKSPLRGNWDGVTLEYVSDREMNFVLPQPYAPFVENLTVGIVPKHLWEFVTPEEMPFSTLNTNPVGAGPYMITGSTQDDSGIPTSYTLVPFPKYHEGPPHITELTFRFYPNAEAIVAALLAQEITSAAGLDATALASVMEGNDTYALFRTPLPKTFALFFNQNKNPALRDLAVRRALDIAIDRPALVTHVLGSYGYPIDGPLPPGFGFETTYTAPTTTLSRADEAREILRKGGWRMNEETGLWEKKLGDEMTELKLSLSTAQNPTLEATTELISTSWSDIGIPVEVKKFEQSDLVQSVIRPREFETILFGTTIGRELDLYSFWHSSQRTDPGLNIALYANISTDAALADTRSKVSFEERKGSYERFAAEFRNDLPALFLYVPEFTYILPKDIHDISITRLAQPAERFSTLPHWYMDTESVWPFFVKN